MWKRKKLTGIVLTSLLVLSLAAGCGAAAEAETDPAAAEPQEETEVTGSDAEETEEPSEEAEAEVSEEQEETAEEPEETVTEKTGIQGEAPELVDTPFDLSAVDENGKKYLDCHGNSFLCSEGSKDDYPELAGALTAIDEKVKAAYQENIYNFDDEAKEFAAEQEKYGVDDAYFSWSETTLKYASPTLVSLLRLETAYLGGAHPNHWYVCNNLDAAAGKEIPLSDIISDQKGLNDLLKDKLNAAYPDGNFFDLDESLNVYSLEGDGESEPVYDFTLDEKGITFYFGPYDLNSYADGTQEVTLSFEELGGVLKQEFMSKYF